MRRTASEKMEIIHLVDETDLLRRNRKGRIGRERCVGADRLEDQEHQHHDSRLAYSHYHDRYLSAFKIAEV